jgi:hypothetical protein
LSQQSQLREAEAELRALLHQPDSVPTGGEQILSQIAEMSDAWSTQQLDALLSLAAEGGGSDAAADAERLAERATLAAARVQRQIAKAGA